MLSGAQVRVRFARQAVVPLYLPVHDPVWLEVAERLLDQHRGREGCTRGALSDEVRDSFSSSPNQQILQGLARLLEDRCEFEVQSVQEPEELRRHVFLAAAAKRAAHRANIGAAPFERQEVLAEVGTALTLAPAEVDRGLFADLKSEQRLVRFEDISARRLLERYNVALAQGVLLRSTRLHIELHGATPARCRQICRRLKFHRLVCEVEMPKKGELALHLDGPLSLFSATHKYGLQLALFLPAILACPSFELKAELRWGTARKEKTFRLSDADGLAAPDRDPGQYVPPELAMFAELFRKKQPDWELADEGEIFPLGKHFWVPDFRLTQRASGRFVHLEVLGFWRRSSLDVYLERLRAHAKTPFVLAVSEQLHVEEAELEGLPAFIHRFRQMPLPDEIARLAAASLAATPAS